MIRRFHGTNRLRGALHGALLLLLALPAAVAGQDGGRIVGRIIDEQTGSGISGVQVRAVESGIGALSGLDGRYTLDRVAAGTVSLRVETLGYGTKTVTGVIVPAGGTVEQVVSLSAQALELAAIEVSAAAERGSVDRALDQQRTSANIVNAITTEQMARSPDSDAAAAMQRVSGVTVQDNRFVFVRGLGERYTTTSLNGARIPSAEPERKVVPLDLFPSGLLQSITTSKTFTPDLAGDFSGGQVNIETREFPMQRQVVFSLGGGVNDRATGRVVLGAPRVGPEWRAFSGVERQLPAPARAAGNFIPTPSTDEQIRIVNSFRNVWSVEQRNALPSGSGSLSIGGSDPLFGRHISYLGSFTYSRSHDIRADQRRAVALPAGDAGVLEIDRYTGSTGSESVLWGGLAQLSTLLGEHSRLVLNTTYNRTADNEARSEIGTSENHGNLPFMIDRLRFVERSVFSSQLKGEHELLRRHRFDWLASAAAVERREPDRSEIVYAIQQDPATGAPLAPTLFSGNEAAVRSFGDLTEQAFETGANYRIEFGDPGLAHAIKVGGLLRSAQRDADNRSYSLSHVGLPRTDLQLDPESIFDGRFSRPEDSRIRVTPTGQGGSYTAEDRLVAGYAMLDFALSDAVRVVGGARIERAHVNVASQTTLNETYIVDNTYTDVLPSLGLNVRLDDRMNLRLSGSRTLARPEYRELAPVSYREVIGGESVRGNDRLVRTMIHNADVRWEWYPNAGEVLSLALFGKWFDDPIERVYLATSGTRVVTFVNAEAARNYGVELEVRKRLGTWFDVLEPWTFFANTTVMQSNIEIGGGEASKLNDRRAMVGQAPYVVNAGLTYTSPSGSSSATALYNIVGQRIVNAAEAPLPDVYELSRAGLDLSLRFGLTGGVSAKLDARNLFDSAFEQRQGPVVREHYRTGRTVSVGFTWRL